MVFDDVESVVWGSTRLLASVAAYCLHLKVEPVVFVKCFLVALENFLNGSKPLLCVRTCHFCVEPVISAVCAVCFYF